MYNLYIKVRCRRGLLRGGGGGGGEGGGSGVSEDFVVFILEVSHHILISLR